MKTTVRVLTYFFLLAGTCASIAQGPIILTIDATKPVSAVSPTLYGLMTEEINLN